MEVALISGALALIGGITGSIVGGFVQRAVRERNARVERIEAAIRSIAVAMSARDIPWGLHADTPPPGHSDQDQRELEKQFYTDGLGRLWAALADAKRDLAILAADGYDFGSEWRKGIRLIDALDDLYARLLSIQGIKRSK